MCCTTHEIPSLYLFTFTYYIQSTARREKEILFWKENVQAKTHCRFFQSERDDWIFFVDDDDDTPRYDLHPLAVNIVDGRAAAAVSVIYTNCVV